MVNIGLDVHKRETQVCCLAPTGEVEAFRIRSTRPRFEAVFGSRAPSRVLVETSTESEWVAQCLEGLGHEVLVVDPSFAPMYGGARRGAKTDRRDAWALAQAGATGVYRRVHRVSAPQRAVRLELAVRDRLVRMRTGVVNEVRARVRGVGFRLTLGSPETVPARVVALALPTPLRSALQPLLGVLAQLTREIAAADARLATLAAADPVVLRLQTVPGIGPVTALAFVATLDDVGRFGDARAVAAYLGLVPQEWSSADHARRGHITKRGPTRLRWLLVEAAWRVLRSKQASHAGLQAWAEQVAARRGRPIAVVALARRLARILYALWQTEAPYGARGAGGRSA